MDNEKLLSDQDLALEELVLKETIVSAAGLSADSLQIGIKGDPSLRETSLFRPRYKSPLDNVFSRLEPNLEDLMLNHSTYRLYIGFNSGEIRTSSIFDPMREEIHVAEKLIEPGYIARHFPAISYDDKIKAIRDIYKSLRDSNIFSYMPAHWKSIMEKRAKVWEPMTGQEIRDILSTISVLRELPDFYLRNLTICIVQNMVRMQFNCDGTQIISAENYKQFLQDNLPGE
ncbi:MAG: hypothetical protein BMS9Abin26_0575 [Gammaproteobacteria bacterium]|nr:MAG: hypothetical protein BMS9Abin26_0575 [Gammaproteobacteria bacterium]